MRDKTLWIDSTYEADQASVVDRGGEGFEMDPDFGNTTSLSRAENVISAAWARFTHIAYALTQIAQNMGGFSDEHGQGQPASNNIFWHLSRPTSISSIE